MCPSQQQPSGCAQPLAHACVRGRGAHARYHSRRDNDVERGRFRTRRGATLGTELRSGGLLVRALAQKKT